MQLGDLEEIFECDPEGVPLDPQWIETEPEPNREPSAPAAVPEPSREPAKVGNS